MKNDLTNQAISALYKMQSPKLTNSVDGGGAAAETVRARPNGTITVPVTNASSVLMKTVTIETPIAFDVMGAKVYKTSDNTLIGARAWVNVLNNTNNITDEMTPATGLTGLIASTTLDTNYNSFDVDDDDLVVTVSGSSASALLVVLDIMLT